MTAAVRAFATAASPGYTSSAVDIVIPAAAVVGDRMILVSGCQSADPTSTWPTVTGAAWTQLGTLLQGAGNTRYGAIMSRSVESGDPGATISVQMPFTSVRVIMVLVVVSGSAAPTGAAWQYQSGYGLNVPDQVVVDGELVLAGAHYTTGSGNTANVTPDPPTGWTACGEEATYPTGSSSSQWIYAWSKTPGAGTETGPVGNADGPSLASSAGWSVALESSAAPPTGPTSFVWDGSAEVASSIFVLDGSEKASTLETV